MRAAEERIDYTTSSPIIRAIKARIGRIVACIICTVMLGSIGTIRPPEPTIITGSGSARRRLHVAACEGVRERVQTPRTRRDLTEERELFWQRQRSQGFGGCLASQLILITSTLVSGFAGVPFERVYCHLISIANRTSPGEQRARAAAIETFNYISASEDYYPVDLRRAAPRGEPRVASVSY